MYKDFFYLQNDKNLEKIFMLWLLNLMSVILLNYISENSFLRMKKTSLNVNVLL